MHNTITCSYNMHLADQTGPLLDRLPEELLPALGKFLYIGRDAAEQGEINKEGMEQLQAIIKCLTVLCLNTHNIPLVASIDLVKHVGRNKQQSLIITIPIFR